MSQHPNIYDLLSDFDSYIADVENCLSLDPETWADYENDPAPYVWDILCDFGAECTPAERIAAIKNHGYDVKSLDWHKDFGVKK